MGKLMRYVLCTLLAMSLGGCALDQDIFSVLENRRRMQGSYAVCCFDYAQACCVACLINESYDDFCKAGKHFLGCPDNPNPPGTGVSCTDPPTFSPTESPSPTPTRTPTRTPTLAPTANPTTLDHVISADLVDLSGTVHGMNSTIAVVEAKVDRVEAKVDRVEAKVDGLGAKVDGLKTTMDAILTLLNSDTVEIKSIKTTVGTIGTAVGDVSKDLTAVASDVTDIASDVTDLHDFNFVDIFPGSTILTGLIEARWLSKQLPGQSYTNCWRGSRDGFAASTFHSLCDGKGDTVTIVKDNSGYIFGGYAAVSWSTSGGYTYCSTCFLFSLTGFSNSPVKSSLGSSSNYRFGQDRSPNYGPTFGNGHDLYIRDNCNSYTGSYTNMGHSYNTVTSTTDLGASYGSWKCAEIEVWTVN